MGKDVTKVYKIICKRCGFFDFIKLRKSEFEQIKKKGGLICPKCKAKIKTIIKLSK